MNRAIGYTLGFIGGVLAWIPFLIGNGFTQPWNSDTLLILMNISGTVMKFLSGFGIMLTYATFCSFIFKITASSLKGKKQRLKSIKLFLLLPVIAIAFYAIYILWQTVVNIRPLSFIETLTASYGVWSLLLAIYIVPATRGQYQPEIRKGIMDKARVTISEGKHTLWRGYQFYIRRDYGKVYASEFERYQFQLNSLRSIIGAFLLLPLAVTLFIVPPVAGITFVLWIRILSSDYRPLMRAERLLLVIIVVGVLALTTYLFLNTIGIVTILYLNVSYATGIFLSIATLGYLVLRA